MEELERNMMLFFINSCFDGMKLGTVQLAQLGSRLAPKEDSLQKVLFDDQVIFLMTSCHHFSLLPLVILSPSSSKSHLPTKS